MLHSAISLKKMKKTLLDNDEITLDLEDGILIAKFKVQHFDLETV